MFPKSILTTSMVLASLASASTLFAQSAKNTTSEVKRHVPTTEEGVKGYAKLTNRAVSPALKKALSPEQLQKNEIARQRIAKIFAQKADYMAKLEKGHIAYQPELTKLSQQLTEQLPQLQADYQTVLASRDTAESRKLTDAFLSSLQPFGLVLEYAEPRKVNHTLTKKQVAEYRQLAAAKDAAFGQSKKSNNVPFFVGTKHLFTLLDLEMPLLVKAEPGSTVYFESIDGGRFANGLNLTKAVADKHGLAVAHWVSHGTSVAEARISAVSSDNLGIAETMLCIMQLKPRELVDLTEFRQLTQQNAKDLKKSLEHQAEDLRASKPQNISERP